MDAMRPVVISIGGWDPCGGAGLAADIKTFEQCNVTGMGVCSALTCQTHDRFVSLQWTDINLMLSQLNPLINIYNVKALKFGIMPDMTSIVSIIHAMRCVFPKIPVIWDPVLKASAGFDFHQQVADALLNELMQLVTLVTPNLPEAIQLFGEDASSPAALQQRMIADGWGAVLLKGGHASDHADDVLITNNEIIRIEGQRFGASTAKHGSGCVLSSAIAAHLAQGFSLPDACRKGKQYVEHFLLSGDGLMGYHVQFNDTKQ
jgi:hydroxymethylpyrimidine/phosphomethylpyrimidine kinase